jgi:hypothetical protein
MKSEKKYFNRFDVQVIKMNSFRFDEVYYLKTKNAKDFDCTILSGEGFPYLFNLLKVYLVAPYLITRVDENK